MTLRPRDKLAIGVVTAVVAIIAFYLLILTPVHHRATRLDAAITSQQQTLVQDESTYQAGKTAQAALRKNGAQASALARAVPDTSNIPALLRILEHNANVSNVSIQAITLSGSSSSSSAPVGTPAATGADAPTSVPISLTFTGDYAQLDRLLGRLDSLVTVSGQHVHASGPLLNITSVSLSGGGSKLTAQITASIYQLGNGTTTTASPTAATSSTEGTS